MLDGRVHIHSCGNGFYWFRPYGGLLGKAPSNQALLPLSFGASPRLGMPSLRSCSVGPPRPAIHGLTRLTRHPCRVAHCAEPPLGLSGGRAPRKAKARRGELTLDLVRSQSLIPIFLWERACRIAASPRRRLASQPDSGPVHIPTVGASLLAMRPDGLREFCGCFTSKRSQPRCTRQLLQEGGGRGFAFASKPGRPVGRLGAFAVPAPS
jgi:hypothetical protein